MVLDMKASGKKINSTVRVWKLGTMEHLTEVPTWMVKSMVRVTLSGAIKVNTKENLSTII